MMDPCSALVKHTVCVDQRVPVKEAVVVVGNAYQRRLFESALINHVPNFNVYKTAFNNANNMSRLYHSRAFHLYGGQSQLQYQRCA